MFQTVACKSKHLIFWNLDYVNEKTACLNGDAGVIWWIFKMQIRTTYSMTHSVIVIEFANVQI